MTRRIWALWAMVLLMLSLSTAQAQTLAEAEAHYRRGDYAAALPGFFAGAQRGDATAQYFLGTMSEFGLGVAQSDLLAVFWYRRAAEQGLADAQVNLGSMYANGLGVSKDDREAVRWYRAAAEQGFWMAQFNLALMYAKGEGLPKDDQTAYFWLLLASVQGEDEAIRVRDMVERRLIPQDRAAAQAAARDWKPKSATVR